MLSEFELIRRYFSPATRHTLLAGGDDAALVAVTPGQALAVSADMLVSGRHFLADADAAGVGHKSLAVNLSDMAAMGAMPRWVTLSVALPDANEEWVGAFMRGFLALAGEHDVEFGVTGGPQGTAVTREISEPEVSIHASSFVLMQMATGEVAVDEALGSGALRASGDVEALADFPALFEKPTPPTTVLRSENVKRKKNDIRQSWTHLGAILDRSPPHLGFNFGQQKVGSVMFRAQSLFRTYVGSKTVPGPTWAPNGAKMTPTCPPRGTQDGPQND